MKFQKCLRDVGSERSVGDVSVKASTELGEGVREMA